mgnify:CR=1 FL=1
MKFAHAMQALQEGKRITRSQWLPQSYLEMKDNRVRDQSGTIYPFCQIDQNGEWIIYHPTTFIASTPTMTSTTILPTGYVPKPDEKFDVRKAVDLMLSGHKVRQEFWLPNWYLQFDPSSFEFRDERNKIFKLASLDNCEWTIYQEKQECPKDLEIKKLKEEVRRLRSIPCSVNPFEFNYIMRGV